MTVRKLLTEVDSAELSEWMAFDRIDIDDDWKRNAQLCHLIASVNTPKGKRGPRFEDFLPSRRKPDISPADLRARLATLRKARP